MPFVSHLAAPVAWPELALVAALGGAAALGLGAHRHQRLGWALAEGALSAAAIGALVRLAATAGATAAVDRLGLLMLALVTLLGAVVVRYSRRYLDGSPRQGRYLAWLSLTLLAVVVLVGTRHLLWLYFAWVGASLTLHPLLRHFAGRPGATLAARKKFLLGRIADVVIGVAVLLLMQAVGDLHMERIAAAARAVPEDPRLQAAALLLVAGVVLKSAQLPFHGWLLQVMEAPTPVSALLHAGIVNIGGFVLLRLGPVLETSATARGVLVCCGGITALLAGLVMLTRISVKVMLAWSTCAQMGFMLLEIGLGAYPLALLHLLAHSLYKAHAFLSAGSAVAPPARTQPPAPALAALTCGVATLVLGLGFALGAFDPRDAAAAAVLALAPLLGLPALCAVAADGSVAALRARLLLGAATLALAYAAGHQLLALVLAPAAVPASLPTLAAAAACLIGLAAVQAMVLRRPHGRVSRWLYPHAYAGFHLDAPLGALVLRLWPPTAATPALGQRHA
ncbi:MAG: NADH-quinone oxidoreductase subunit L [Lysobacterales bacterium]